MDFNVEEVRARLKKLDTPAVSDAMDSLGVNRALHGIECRTQGVKVAGPVFTVQYERFDKSPETFQNAGNYIDQVPAGAIVLINNYGDTSCTNWGDILTRKAMSSGIEGTVVNGSARDLAVVRELGYPLFSKGIYMVSGKNRVRVSATNVPVEINSVVVEPSDWLFADDNGVVVIAADNLLQVLERAENVEKTEERIVAAIESGASLDEARSQYGYSKPWEVVNGN
ncbi:RraA family protein [Pseudoalteromonas sp. T1lg23B]|uniref:RraA family protein n=1 Tax=Pseudoalteromonas sp. T1lg23B TaxID=2077097 RepID=UPI000CF66278|nr:S-adenosylmethionine--2-demethylmenaquinone methyltransferase [Pseudoalteromonas sp. T1lg23B]